jgi:protocatechuate 3,4-dioxygenase beta subunit
MRHCRALSAAAVLLLFACGGAVAQESRANVEGRVTDPQGAVVPGATVSVISEDTNVEQKTTTNEQGSWTVRFLNPGKYRVAVTATGFKKSEQKDIVLQVADMK